MIIGQTNFTLNEYVNDSLENQQEVQIINKVERRHFKKGEFFTMNNLLPLEILQKNYTGLTFRVLFLLLSKLDYNNRIKTFRQIEIANELDTSQANVSRSLKKLLDDHIILKNENDFYFSFRYIAYSNSLTKKEKAELGGEKSE